MTLYDIVISSDPMPMPPKPEFLVEYDRMPQGLAKEKAWNQISYSQSYKIYSENKWKVNLHNRDSLIALRSFFEKNDTSLEQKALIKNKIEEFFEVIGNQKLNVYPALRINPEDFKYINCGEPNGNNTLQKGTNHCENNRN